MTFVSILVGILIFSILVITHEFGHFIMARIFKIGVIEFSVGMGPRIWSHQGKRTRFSLKAIPFGGSCSMVGEDAAGGGEIGLADEEDEELREMIARAGDSFQTKSVFARICTIIGGPLFNILTALILAVIMVSMSGTNPAKVYNVAAGYGAETAGIQVGDEILSINGSGISVGREIQLYLYTHPLGDTVTVEYLRDGEKHSVTYDPTFEAYRLGISYTADTSGATLSDVASDSAAAIAGLVAGDIITSIDGTGITTGEDMQKYFAEHPLDGSEITVTYRRTGTEKSAVIMPTQVKDSTLGFAASYYSEEPTFGSVLTGCVKETVYAVKSVIYSLRMLFTGQAGLKDLSGPVGIVSVIGDTITTSAEVGISTVVINLLSLSVLLSVNLGIVNLFPFPALDGGRLVLLIIEGITRKKLPPKAEGILNMVGFVLLMILMVVIFFSDLMKLFS
ncbi:MAG: RIP metalloprotease RseP [Lachnospiraceae bacterium]|nr:RIP metalloprotease RseP [Lachnospiraceae bacterium]